MTEATQASAAAVEISLEKRKFVRWIKRKHSEHYELLRGCAARLNEALSGTNWIWKDVTLHLGNTSPHEIYFERMLPGSRFSYIYMTMDRFGSMNFFVYFAVRRDHEPHEFLVDGDLVRFQRHTNSSMKWGPRWYHWNKEKKFLTDWQTLIECVPAIVDFLENGTPHKHIWKSEYLVDQL